MTFFRTRNPTELEVGAEGRLGGNDYRVVGRIAMANAAGFRWQEYYLKGSGGVNRLLVFEAGEWKLFQLFEPRKPVALDYLQRAHAEGVLRLDDETLFVDYVEESKVLYIEGEAPEGYAEGSRSRYLNGRLCGEKIVISWKDSEVEYYQGQDLPEPQVRRSFGLPEPGTWRQLVDMYQAANWSRSQMLGTLFSLAALALIIGENVSPEPSFSEPPPLLKASPGGLSPGDQGDLRHHSYRIKTSAIVDMHRPGRSFERHEYSATDEFGQPALLVQRLDAKSDDWLLMTPDDSWPNVSPSALARWHPGPLPANDPKKGNVLYIFQSLARAIDGVAEPDFWQAAPTAQYGFFGFTDGEYFLVRWDAQRVSSFKGVRLSRDEVVHAFGSKAAD